MFQKTHTKTNVHVVAIISEKTEKHFKAKEEYHSLGNTKYFLNQCQRFVYLPKKKAL